MFKEPQNSDLYHWTAHAKMKMRQYGLSAARLKRVIRAPERVEEGIAPATTAAMQPRSVRRDGQGRKTWTSEIWVMYRPASKAGSEGLLGRKKLIIISAWCYPGRTKPGSPLPEEIKRELEEAGF